jgi:hypothetical protein
MTIHPAFAVRMSYPMFCPSTDAIMGTGSHICARFATKAEADAYAAAKNKVEFEDGWCETGFSVEMRPWREGEDKVQRPQYSMPELICDAWAKRQQEREDSERAMLGLPSEAALEADFEEQLAACKLPLPPPTAEQLESARKEAEALRVWTAEQAERDRATAEANRAYRLRRW